MKNIEYKYKIFFLKYLGPIYGAKIFILIGANEKEIVCYDKI